MKFFDLTSKRLLATLVALAFCVATAHALVSLAHRLRSLHDRGLAEVPSTRLLIATARLIAGGIAVRDACYVALVSPLSDDATLVAAMRDLVDATFV